MFKLPGKIPALQDSSQEWADYAEFRAIELKHISLYTLVKGPKLIRDEINVNGIEDDSDSFQRKSEDIVTEISHRARLLGELYPFQLQDRDYSIAYKGSGNFTYTVYLFLLMATRVNMTSHRVQGGVDGTKIFEALSAEVITQFLGRSSEAHVLGTSKTDIGGFRKKLAEISKKMREGGLIHENPHYRPQDDTVDVIAWKKFNDDLSSQLIGFAQCKTGTSWRHRLSELNAQAFCNRWFSVQPVLLPIRMFFCAQYFPREIWYELATSAGLIFDRFRIIENLPVELSDELLKEIEIWTRSSLEKYVLQSSN